MAPPPPHDGDGGDESSRSSVVTVDVKVARELMASGGHHRYLDVRTEEEVRKLGHLDLTNLNVPYMFTTPTGSREKNALFLHQVASLFPTKHDHIIVGCQSGKRSELACIDLLAAGFKNVKNMGGGYLAWIHNGFPVITDQHNNAPPTITNNADAAAQPSPPARPLLGV